MHTKARIELFGGLTFYHIRQQISVMVLLAMAAVSICFGTAQNNETVSLSALKGRTVLVNFWASWCKPCQKEIPELNRIYEKFSAQGFSIVGINIDKEKANAERYMERIPISYTVAFDSGMSVIDDYKAPGMPSSYIIDKNGIVREIIYGFSEKKKALIESSITALLNE
jgi:thiol-disulfide isomerase/thioredoxin